VSTYKFVMHFDTGHKTHKTETTDAPVYGAVLQERCKELANQKGAGMVEAFDVTTAPILITKWPPDAELPPKG